MNSLQLSLFQAQSSSLEQLSPATFKLTSRVANSQSVLQISGHVDALSFSLNQCSGNPVITLSFQDADKVSVSASGAGQCNFTVTDGKGSATVTFVSSIPVLSESDPNTPTTLGRDAFATVKIGVSKYITFGGSPTGTIHANQPGTGRVFEYDFSAGGDPVIRELAPMNHARYGFTATLLSNQKVLLVGGVNAPNNTILDFVELYDLSANGGAGSSSDLSPLPSPRHGHYAKLLPGDRVALLGGYDGSSVVNTVLAYDPALNAGSGGTTWMNPLSVPRLAFSTVELPDGGLFLSGGGNGSASTDVEIYRPIDAGETTTLSPLQTARHYHSSILLPDGRILLVAGFQTFTSVEVYDRQANSGAGVSATLADIQSARYGTRLVSGAGGRVFILGGVGPGFQPIAANEVYDPLANVGMGTSFAIGGFSMPRSSFFADVLTDGRIWFLAGATGGTNTTDSWGFIVE